MLSSKAFFALDEVVAKLSISLNDIEYLVQQGVLEMSVRFAEVLIDDNKLKLLTKNNGNSCIIRCNKILLIKPKTITKADACALFRRETAIISAFKNDENLKVLNFIKGSNIFVKGSDMVITKEELSKIQDNSKSLVEKIKEKFKHNNNYQKITYNDIEFSFGETQAKIIEQLHQAAKTNNPWVNGKILLKNANSNASRLYGLFQRHPKWKKLIISDGKGNYCLNLR